MANTDEWPAFKNFLQENEIAIETSDPPLPLSHFPLDPRPFSIRPFAFHASLLQKESWIKIFPHLLWVIGLHPNHKI